MHTNEHAFEEDIPDTFYRQQDEIEDLLYGDLEAGPRNFIGPPPTQVLRVIITENKRMTAGEIAAMKELAKAHFWKMLDTFCGFK